MTTMTPLLISLTAFAVILAGAVLGALVRRKLPDRHLSGDTRDVVRQGTALIATLASLVLGLLIASANARYETDSSQVVQLTANIILVDGALRQYGPEAASVRDLLRRQIGTIADRIWSGSQPNASKPFQADSQGPAIYDDVLKLTPKTDAQHFYKVRSMDTLVEFAKTRLLLFASATGSIPRPFLAVLVGWLALIFASISMFAESNARTFTILGIFALAASSAIFLILELSQPFAGLMRISDEPFRNSLAALSP